MSNSHSNRYPITQIPAPRDVGSPIPEPCLYWMYSADHHFPNTWFLAQEIIFWHFWLHFRKETYENMAIYIILYFSPYISLFWGSVNGFYLYAGARDWKLSIQHTYLLYKPLQSRHSLSKMPCKGGNKALAAHKHEAAKHGETLPDHQCPNPSVLTD